MADQINESVVARQGGLGPAQNIVGGLGQVSQQSVPDNGYRRNSSLELFELANAEKQKAKEMFYENEAMKARAAQQELGNENSKMQQNEIDNSILSALKSGSIDEATANAIFQDRRISDTVKSEVANAFYPSKTKTASDVLNTDNQNLGSVMNVDNELSNYVPDETSRDISNSYYK